MQFIVEWLRRGVCGENMGCAPRACACALMDDAADHIELLQDEIRTMRAGQKGEDVSDQPLFHLTPQEVYDLFEAGVGHGVDHSNCAWNSHRAHLLDIMFTHAMHIRHQDGNPVHDRDELRHAIEAMFKGVE